MPGAIFLDKREDSASDLLTVSETAHEPPSTSEEADPINHPDKLALEATMVNQSFSQQVLMEVEGQRKTVSILKGCLGGSIITAYMLTLTY